MERSMMSELSIDTIVEISVVSDRINKAVDAAKKKYEPELSGISARLIEKRDPDVLGSTKLEVARITEKLNSDTFEIEYNADKIGAIKSVKSMVSAPGLLTFTRIFLNHESNS